MVKMARSELKSLIIGFKQAKDPFRLAAPPEMCLWIIGTTGSERKTFTENTFDNLIKDCLSVSAHLNSINIAVILSQPTTSFKSLAIRCSNSSLIMSYDSYPFIASFKILSTSGC